MEFWHCNKSFGTWESDPCLFLSPHLYLIIAFAVMIWIILIFLHQQEKEENNSGAANSYSELDRNCD